MDIRTLIASLVKRWYYVVAAVVVALGVATALTLTATKQYTSTAELFVSAHNSGSDLNAAYEGSLFSQQQAESYAAIANKPLVTAPVIKQLRLNTTSSGLAGQISAKAITNTVLIDVSVTDTSPIRAQRICAAVAQQFAGTIDALQRGPDGQSPVKASITDPASLPGGPSSPHPFVNLLLGLLLGLAVGCSGAVLATRLDTSVKDAQEVGDRFGLTVLGQIGEVQTRRGQPIGLEALPARTAEEYRQLRTNLRFVDLDRPPEVILVTSAVPSEGKTTTVCNIAAVVAQAGMSVVVVDADLRRPRVSSYEGIHAPYGLTDVLLHNADLDQALYSPPDRPQISYLLPGTLPPNPSEILESARMGQVLAQLRGRADVVLIDAPPVLPVTDAAVLSAHSDGALLVVRSGQTKRDDLQGAIDALHKVDARVLGVVLNMSHAARGKTYTYYTSAPMLPAEEPRRAHVA